MGSWLLFQGLNVISESEYSRACACIITVLLMLVGIIPCLVLKGLVLESYETRAVEVRTAEIQNQCTILCSQLSNSNYQDNGISDIIQSELTQLANVYHGRIMVIDNDFCIMSDTDDKDVGRKMVAESVVKCFRGDKAFRYDRDNRFIEVTAPVRVSEDSEITGVVLVSVSTDTIAATKALLAKKSEYCRACDYSDRSDCSIFPGNDHGASVCKDYQIHWRSSGWI